MTTNVITIDLASKCPECKAGGTTPNGLCVKCTTKAINGRAMRSAVGHAVAMRFKAEKKSWK